MANIKSFPNNQDEYIGAEYVMKWLHGRTSGVFGAAGNANVSPVLDSMAVTVSDGNGWMANDKADGVVWWIDNEAVNGSKLQLSVDMADAVLPRIDRVIVSWETTNYVAYPTVSILKGAPASSPVAPALTNNSLLRQISLAKINIPAGTTAITSAMITDERLDGSVCGLVTAGMGVDTSLMQAQFNNAYNDMLGYVAAQKAAWDTFFAAVTLDTVFPVPSVDDAGKLPVVNADASGYELLDMDIGAEINAKLPKAAAVLGNTTLTAVLNGMSDNTVGNFVLDETYTGTDLPTFVTTDNESFVVIVKTNLSASITIWGTNRQPSAIGYAFSWANASTTWVFGWQKIACGVDSNLVATETTPIVNNTINWLYE